MYVFGPETHMTAIVGMALGKRAIPKETEQEFATANFLLPGGQVNFVQLFIYNCAHLCGNSRLNA